MEVWGNSIRNAVDLDIQDLLRLATLCIELTSLVPAENGEELKIQCFQSWSWFYF